MSLPTCEQEIHHAQFYLVKVDRFIVTHCNASIYTLKEGCVLCDWGRNIMPLIGIISVADKKKENLVTLNVIVVILANLIESGESFKWSKALWKGSTQMN